MRKLTIVFVLLLVLLTMGYSLFPTQAASIEDANAAMTKTERSLAEAVSTSTADVRELQDHLTVPDELPQALQAFERTTVRLQNLQQELLRDIGACDTALIAKLTEFDRELQAIQDSATRRQMERLRNRVHTESQERILTAQEELADLQSVLAQGADLQHAAKCVQLGDELVSQGQDLAYQVEQIKDQAAQYAKTTGTLLARLTATESE